MSTPSVRPTGDCDLKVRAKIKKFLDSQSRGSVSPFVGQSHNPICARLDTLQNQPLLLLDTRLTNSFFKSYLLDGLEDRIAKADQLAEVAKEIGATLPQFSIAWVAANTNVSIVMLGATSIKQLDENLKALAFIDKITPEIRATVDAIVQFQPVMIPSAEPIAHHFREKFLQVLYLPGSRSSR